MWPLKTVKTPIPDPQHPLKVLASVELTEVTWKRRFGAYNADTQSATKVFLNKEDAEVFASALKDAAKILRYTENIHVHIGPHEAPSK